MNNFNANELNGLNNAINKDGVQCNEPFVNHYYEDRIYDVVVVGAGVIGTTIAEKLQHEGKQVLLLDRDGIGEGCSKGNAGHFATDIIFPLANFSTLLKAPKFLLDPLGPLTIDLSYLPKLLPWLMRFAWSAMPHKTKLSMEVLKRLNRPAITRYQELLTRINAEELMSQRGALTVYQSRAGEKANLRHAKVVSKHGISVEVLNSKQVLALEPEFTSQIRGGLFFPDTAHSIEPYQLVLKLAKSFIQKGGRFLKSDVKSIMQPTVNTSNQLVQVNTREGEFRANNVIVACGAWSKNFAESLGHNVPLETERGYHYMLPQPQVTIHRPITCFEKSFVMTPMQKGLRLAGTVELAGLNKEANIKRAEQLFDNARGLLKNLNNANATTWMGHRPSLPDSLPIISQSKSDHVIFAFGHQHLGLTQAAVTADLVSDLLENRMDDFLQKQLSINRF